MSLSHHPIFSTQRAITIVLGVVLVLSSSCRRNETQAAHVEERPLSGIAMTPHTIAGLGTLDVPQSWHLDHVEYPSRYGNQHYNVVKASYHEKIDTEGVLTIDISPSHPRLWRKPLTEWVEHRYRALRTLGAVRTHSLVTPTATGDLPYQCEERSVTIDNRLRAVFRIFRQKSRVVVVTYTADVEHFDEQAATQMVQHTSDTLIIDLPVVPFQRPSLALSHRVIPDVLAGKLPTEWAWTMEEEWADSPVPIQNILFRPTGDRAGDVTLTLSLARLSALMQQIQFETVAIMPPNETEFDDEVENNETLLRVEDERMTVIRITHVGDDVLTTTYSTPDYLFDVKAAYELLDNVVDSVQIVPLSTIP